MDNIIIEHIDDAPWIRGRPSPLARPRELGSQLIGDLKEGPWIYVNTVPPGHTTPVHSHGQDEVFFILEGALRVAGQTCRPGTIVAVRKGVEYSFTASPEGAKFLEHPVGPRDHHR